MFSSTNTTGSRCTPAQFIASWKSPREVEPSPKNVSATRASPRSLNAIAMPAATHIMSGSIETIGTQPRRGVAEVDVAVAPAGDAARAAHVLGEDPRRLDAAHEVRAEVAVEDAEAVLRRHRERRADRHGLLPEAVVEGAGHAALAVERQRARLDGAHQQHVAQQRDAVGRGEVRRGAKAGSAVVAGPALCVAIAVVHPFTRGAERDLRPSPRASARDLRSGAAAGSCHQRRGYPSLVPPNG